MYFEVRHYRQEHIRPPAFQESIAYTLHTCHGTIGVVKDALCPMIGVIHQTFAKSLESSCNDNVIQFQRKHTKASQGIWQRKGFGELKVGNR